MTLLRRLRKLLSPPRRYYRCGPGRNGIGCGRVVVRRWRVEPITHWQKGFALSVCGFWIPISAASASAQRHRLGA
jgi:hypothetical protein